MARLAVCLALALSVFAWGAAAQQFGGATSVADLIRSMMSASGVGLPAYQSTGSGAGINGFISGQLAVGLSDNPLAPAQYSKAKANGITPGTFPITLATYSVMNKKGGFSLKACDLAKIYTGKITSWSQVSGSGLSGTIVPLMRNSGSGTTEVFTDYLRKACPAQWPNSLVGTGPFQTGNPNLKLVAGSDGMGSTLAADDSAIGYAQTNFGLVKYKVKEVGVQNKAGKLVTAAASDPYLSVPRSPPSTFKSWSGVSLIYKAGAKTFPMVSFVYLLARKSYKGVSGGKKVVSFLKYAMSFKGQSLASTAYFSRLPSKVIATNNNGIKVMTA